MIMPPDDLTNTRESRSIRPLLDGLSRDMRDAGRSIRRNPLFTLAAVTCIVLGIATATTVFSVFEAMLLRPFPFDEPDELVSLSEINERTEDRTGFSHRRYMEWREGTRLYTDIAAYAGQSVAITDHEEPDLVDGQLVSWNLFPMLGINPQFGRLFNSSDDQPGAPGAVLLSDAVWARIYASDSSILGRVISLDGRAHTVVGVMPPRFKFPEMSEIWLPLAQSVNSTSGQEEAVSIIARLIPDVDVDQADAEIAAYSQRSVRLDTEGSNDVWTGEARSLAEAFIGLEERVFTASMMGAVLFLLVLVCANVANLWLSRAADRQREFAIRAAVGAGRRHLIRQLLIEPPRSILLVTLLLPTLVEMLPDDVAVKSEQDEQAEADEDGKEGRDHEVCQPGAP